METHDDTSLKIFLIEEYVHVPITFMQVYEYRRKCIFCNNFIKFDTVKPLKTATPRGMKNWPSYRGGRLIEVILLRILRASLHLGNEKVAVLQRWPS